MSHTPPESTPLLSPELLVRAYCAGAFPMARQRDGQGGIDWFSPDPRAILPLDDGFKVRRSLAKRVRQQPFKITHNLCFTRVIAACAEPRADSEETWISGEIVAAFTALHRVGLAHSIEAWEGGPQHGELVGGLYGVALGAAFFGESMFSRRPNASQLCLVNLVDHLRLRGYTLLDVQFVNPHLEQFGVTEIPRAQYMRRLRAALARETQWDGNADV